MFRRSLMLLVLSATLLAGCSSRFDPNVPEPIRTGVDPELGRTYELYRPSHYDRGYAWPLIVVCHSSFPDAADKRLKAWAPLAEQYGFIVVAPRLESVGTRWPARPDQTLRDQREDEKHILAVMTHLRAGHNISNDRIFIHGWSGGAMAALRVGLRHPDLIRAISLSQPKFTAGFLADVSEGIDRHQPVHVHYGVDDIISGKQGRRCADWLREKGLCLTEDSIGPVDPQEMGGAVAFFEEVVRKVPWIHIRALPGPDRQPLQVRFKIRSSHQPTQAWWNFGDGRDSMEIEPVHTYDKPGVYTVRVTVDGMGADKEHRRIKLQIPEIFVSVR